MTRQIGLVGSDSIVIASDRAAVLPEPIGLQTTEVSKFRRSGDNLFAFAGLDLAELMAGDLAEAYRLNPNSDLASTIARSFQERMPGKTIGGWILSLVRGELFVADIIVPNPATEPVTTKRITGGRSSASFFSERYYRKNMSTSELMALGAMVVCIDAKFNPQSISGLEIAACTKSTGRLTVFGPDSPVVELLQKKADAADRQLQRSIARIARKANQALLAA